MWLDGWVWGGRWGLLLQAGLTAVDAWGLGWGSGPPVEGGQDADKEALVQAISSIFADVK